MPMFNVGPLEWVMVGLVAMMLFGTGRIVEVGGALGKAIKAFNAATRGDEALPSPDCGTDENT